MVLRQQYEPLGPPEEQIWETADMLLSEFESRKEQGEGGL